MVVQTRSLSQPRQRHLELIQEGLAECGHGSEWIRELEAYEQLSEAEGRSRNRLHLAGDPLLQERILVHATARQLVRSELERTHLEGPQRQRSAARCFRARDPRCAHASEFDNPSSVQQPYALPFADPKEARVRVRAVTAAWGDWHVGYLLSATLPSLVSEGNLPELCKAHDLTYDICTTRRDAHRILASPAFSVLDDLARVEIHILDDDELREPIAAHHRVWHQAVQRARQSESMILFIPPDAVWADGALASLSRRISEGKTVLFNTYLRTDSETFVPALLERFATSPARLRVSPREMVDLALQHLHPLMSCYLQEGGHLPEHAEFLLWPVPGEGLLLRLLARELLCFDSRIPLNDQALLAELPDLARTHLFDDSDELCAVSLTPAWKDFTWYRQPRRFDPVRIATWWLVYDSPVNDVLCRQPVRFHRGIRDEAAWREVTEQSAAAVERIRTSRNVLRLCRTLRFAGMDQSALALAVALLDLDLLDIWKIPATLFLPTNQACQEHLGWRFHHLLMEWDGEKLRRFLGAHSVPGLVELGRPWSPGSASGVGQSLRTVLGETLELDTTRRDSPRVGSARVVGYGFDVDGVRVYPIDTPLCFGREPGAQGPDFR